VLDVGGGPGTYAVPLAEGGYQVHLVDPLPLHVRQAEPGRSSDPSVIGFSHHFIAAATRH
jgi:2-polyprenyl-3-methyl-5-hydroxy-6-metoxy-1,4-benzoquinol methylase